MVYDDLLRIRIPSTLSARLETVAEQFARKRSDVAREAIIVHLNRLSQGGKAMPSDPDFPEAA